MRFIFRWLSIAFMVLVTLVSLTACSPQNVSQTIGSATSKITGTTSSDGVSGTLDVYMLDIGQGDAILLQVGDSYHLIDTGDVDQRDTIVAQLKHMNIKKLDTIIITHPHADHMGGFLALAKNFEIGTVYDDGVSVNSNTYKSYSKWIESHHIKHLVLTRGDTVDFGHGAVFSVLAPWKDDLDAVSDKQKKKDLNDYSIVGRLTFGKFSMLFTGDMEKNEEAKLIKNDNTKLSSRILKVAHHGSPYTTSKDFIRSVRPEAALISVGLHNDYHHPGEATLKRLQAENVSIYRTDTMGRIHIATDGQSWKITTER